MKLTQVPMGLVLFRFAMGPLLIALSLTGSHPLVSFVILVAALLSDIFDGVLARKLGVATEKLRLLDSRADLTFWLCATVALGVVRTEFVREHASEIIAVLMSQALTYVFSFAKFQRAPSVHALVSKFFGLSLLAGVTALLCFGAGGAWFYVMVGLGLLANIEVIVILSLLPEWRHDIPSWYHALCIRRGLSPEPGGLVKFFYRSSTLRQTRITPPESLGFLELRF